MSHISKKKESKFTKKHHSKHRLTRKERQKLMPQIEKESS